MYYNKIHLIHIPKTAGWYLRTELLDFVVDGLKEKNIQLIDLEDHWHNGWTQVDDRTYTITSFRDPVKRLVSHFTYMIGLLDYYTEELEKRPEFWFSRETNEGTYELSNPVDHAFLVRQTPYFVIKNNEQVHGYRPTIEDLFRWIEDNKFYLSNYQAKNIMLDYDINDYQFFWKDFYFDLVGKGLKKEHVYFRLGKINILLKDTQLNYKNMDQLKLKIKQDLGFSCSVNNPAGFWSKIEPVSPWNSGHNIFDGSKLLYEQLTQEQKDYIYSFNEIDTQIYNDYSLFWNSGR